MILSSFSLKVIAAERAESNAIRQELIPWEGNKKYIRATSDGGQHWIPDWTEVYQTIDKATANAYINCLESTSNNLTLSHDGSDTTQSICNIITQDANGSNTNYYRRPLVTLWNYIKGKAAATEETLTLTANTGGGVVVSGPAGLKTVQGDIMSGTGSSTALKRVIAQSQAGSILLYSDGTSANGARGIYVGAHGTGAAKTVLYVDTNNEASFYGKITQTAVTDNNTYKILITANTNPTSGQPYEIGYDTDITINPSTNTITATNFAGNASTATKATKDGSGNVITSTYLTQSAASTTYLTKADASSTYVKKAGDTMTGNLTINKASGSGLYIQNSNQTTDGVGTNKLALTISDAGNQGLYSYGYWNGTTFTSGSKFIVHRDTNGDINYTGGYVTAGNMVAKPGYQFVIQSNLLNDSNPTETTTTYSFNIRSNDTNKVALAYFYAFKQADGEQGAYFIGRKRFTVNGEDTNVNSSIKLSVDSNQKRLCYITATTTINSTANAAGSTEKSSSLMVTAGSTRATAIELLREGSSSWQILNSGGHFYLRNNWTTALGNYATKFAMSYNTGNAAISGTLALGQTGTQADYRLLVNGDIKVYKSTTIAHDYPAIVRFVVNQTDNDRTSGNSDAYIAAYDDHDAQDYGLNMVIKSAGNMIIGGGESPSSCYTNDIKGTATENMYITSDNNIYFYPGAGTYANHKTLTMSAAGAFGTNGKTSYNTTVGEIMEGTGKLDIQRNATGNYIQLFNGTGTTGVEHGRWDTTAIGTTSAAGNSRVIIGNNLSSTTAGNAIGYIYLGANGGYVNCYGALGSLGGTDRRYIQFGYIKATQVWGAVWNDYAEFRKDNVEEKELQKPGRCVREIGDGSLALTTKRLERGCEIVSDTYGFAIGEDVENGYTTPIASSGRVLAYPYEDVEEFRKHIGWPVCSGPNGTVSIMTEEEEEKYPSRIIGTISEIPSYEKWGSGEVVVNGRVWIRIK